VVRQLDAILLRQESRHDDVERLADLLRRLLHAEFLKALRTELGRRPRRRTSEHHRRAQPWPLVRRRGFYNST
jgi:hypothetical protein